MRHWCALTSVNSHSILAGPLSGGCFVLWSISLVDVGDLGNEGIVWVGICQQRTDGEKNLRDCQSWWPLVLEDIKADGTIRIDVRMIDSCSECALGWFERVVCGEVNVEEEHTASVGAVIGAEDGGLPVILIFFVNGTGWAVGRGVSPKINQFLLDSLQCHN